jgi:hypothetical protein
MGMEKAGTGRAKKKMQITRGMEKAGTGRAKKKMQITRGMEKAGTNMELSRAAPCPFVTRGIYGIQN